MQWANFKALVKAYDGWIEGEKAYFPTPYLKDCFEAACADFERRIAEQSEYVARRYYQDLSKGILTRTTDYP